MYLIVYLILNHYTNEELTMSDTVFLILVGFALAIVLDLLVFFIKLIFTSKEESYDNFNPSKNEQAEQGRSE